MRCLSPPEPSVDSGRSRQCQCPADQQDSRHTEPGTLFEQIVLCLEPPPSEVQLCWVVECLCVQGRFSQVCPDW